ncbi:chromosome partitioning protein ParB, partial [Salmonella enterica subsp. enterica serovar Give]|nr:chromosome partitioning protein ParB [Salmonella enterica subsp. enterica serovar Give]
MKQVIARGRVLGNSNSEFARMLEGDGEVKTFTLRSGMQARFVKTVVLSGEVESKTFV